MTYIPGQGSTSTSPQTLYATVNTGEMPVGGSPWALSAVGYNVTNSFTVPAGFMLAVRTVAARTHGYGANLYETYALINGGVVAAFPPNPNSAATGAANGAGMAEMTVPVDLNYAAGQTLALSNNLSSGEYGGVHLAGYLISTGVSSSVGAVAFAEPELSIWWGTGIITPINSSSQTARAIAIGDGKAILIFNNVIDKTTMLLDIETGTQTAIYTGTESFPVSQYGYFHGAYQASYSGGKSMTRIAMGAIVSATLNYNGSGAGGCDGYILDIMSGSADGDFRVRYLPRLIPLIYNGRSYAGGYKKVLGFAGIDYLITCTSSAQSVGAQFVIGGAIEAVNIAGMVPVVTTLITGANSLSNAVGYTTNGQAGYFTDYVMRMRGARGNNGRLYLFGHTIGSVPGAITGMTFDHITAVIDSTGALLGSLRTLGKAIDSTFSGGQSGTGRRPATLGISNEANGSERTLALSFLGVYYSSDQNYARLSQTQFQHTSLGVPSIVSGLDNANIAGTNTTIGATAGTLTWGLSNLPYGSIVTPSAGSLGSYFNDNTASSGYGAFDSSADTNSRLNLQGATGQERRTNGVIYGNAAGWYYPTGAFVEKRSRTDFGALVSTGYVTTVVDNPVQAIAGTTQLLVVGVNGQWEIVTP